MPSRIAALSAYCLWLAAATAVADVYKWRDGQGGMHYSQEPPTDRRATILGIEKDAPAPRRPTAPGECQTIQCQYDRLRKDRLASDAELRAERSAAAQRAQATPQSRGMTFEVYSLLSRGMAEAEVLQRAGPPDHESHDGWRGAKTWVYAPTATDPFTTSVILREGRVFEIERRRKF